MDEELLCPVCGDELDIDAPAGGEIVDCVACGTTLEVTSEEPLILVVAEEAKDGEDPEDDEGGFDEFDDDEDEDGESDDGDLLDDD